MSAWQGLVDARTIITAAVLSPTVLAGILLVMIIFQGASDASFRASVFNILIGLSVAGLVRAVFRG